jgi:hypothetical protein
VFEFNLGVTASDRKGTALTSQRCVHFDPVCDHRTRYIPSYGEFVQVYGERFGVVEVPQGRLIAQEPPVVGLRTST